MARPVLYFLCTGNAARSVMAVAMMRRLTDDVEVRGAGTLVLEGHPMSVRTRTALARHGLADPHHRSRQFGPADAEAADLVVAMEPLHVSWMRRTHPGAAPVTGTLRRLVRDLPEVGGDLRGRVEALGLHAVEPESWEEVVDPGSGQQDDFDRCSDELASLVDALHRALR